MPTSTPLTADALRIKNKATGRGMWLVTTDEGTLTTSEVNPDSSHCPDLLVNPVSAPDPAVFTTGVAVVATFQFDGELGAGSTVAVTGSGTVSAINLAGSMMVFSYTAATGDVLKFTAKSADGSKTARRLFTPATVTLGPSYVPDSLTQSLFTHGWAASATASFDRPLAAGLNVIILGVDGLPAGTLEFEVNSAAVLLTNIVVASGASYGSLGLREPPITTAIRRLSLTCPSQARRLPSPL